ncbi:uncharacterized protein LOC122309541 [Carya illinoinensis]|uniref:uncharacterized protein LOC122309541 n=1 Tax=Carya illinoinensis TaxID=32201 RepID=UPI001C71B0FC|nr:uncharacterized protein LOC122309541 [Carya illinoinensis]
MGTPHQELSWYIEVVYESLPAFCTRCKMQGHNLKLCKGKEGAKRVMDRTLKRGDKQMQVWKPIISDHEKERLTKARQTKSLVSLELDDEAGPSCSKAAQEVVNVEEPGQEKMQASSELNMAMGVNEFHEIEKISTENNLELNGIQMVVCDNGDVAGMLNQNLRVNSNLTLPSNQMSCEVEVASFAVDEAPSLVLDIYNSDGNTSRDHMRPNGLGNVVIEELNDEVVVDHVLVGSSKDVQVDGHPVQEGLNSLGMDDKEHCGSDPKKECGEDLCKNK